MPWHIVFSRRTRVLFHPYRGVLDSGIVSSASCSCWLSAARVSTRSNNALYPVTVRLWIWVRGWLKVVLTVLHNRSQNLTANMCLTTLTLSSFFPLNAIKFKFTYSKGWRLVSVIEIFLVNVIVALGWVVQSWVKITQGQCRIWIQIWKLKKHKSILILFVYKLIIATYLF